jgi:hypothetical protein
VAQEGKLRSEKESEVVVRRKEAEEARDKLNKIEE